MDDLVAFLRARLDEEAQAAQGSPVQSWNEADFYVSTDLIPGVRAHIARHDPARVLDEVDAKRRILRWHLDEECCSVCLDDVEGCPLFRALALPYASHPDYREEWRP
ncbi:DUF6221 family protein [Streptomyces smyrnaeus]|uniref:DUF6221 family protein n=1 Tax=Streptomyces smyrnaeus TaxID=1387713 RepID=UPI0033FA04BB